MTFDDCAKQAVKLVRKHMRGTKKDLEDPSMFQQEFDLAIQLYLRELDK